MERAVPEIIDQRLASTNETGLHPIEIALQLGGLVMTFARVERVPRYEDGRRESDVEHSFMLALVAPEIAHALSLQLDLALVHQFSTVHDLIEVKTKDVPTFALSAEKLAVKEAEEKRALKEFIKELPPYLAALLEAYERQDTPEARFVRAVDKLLPIVVDIIGQGKRVMHEDFGVSTTYQLHRGQELLKERVQNLFGDEFPEVCEAHTILCGLFEAAWANT